MRNRNGNLTLPGYVVSEMHMTRRKCEQKFVVLLALHAICC
jgi:transcription initiation factor TFIID subunit TAF12